MNYLKLLVIRPRGWMFSIVFVGGTSELPVGTMVVIGSTVKKARQVSELDT